MNNESFNLTNYIKKELNRNDVSFSKRECLRNIGKAFNEYLSYETLVEEMDDSSIIELENAISRVQFQRKSFTKFIVCSREEADKEETKLRSKGFFTYGEFGGDYGYFQHKKELTDEQEEWLEEHTECCYYHGQPCWVWQKEDFDHRDEDCECRLGRDFSSLTVCELDEEEEKRLGIWQQDIVWSLNGYGDIMLYIDHYYSLDTLKEDALEICDHKLKEGNECPVCKKLISYDGKGNFIEGNIIIKVKKKGESSDDD